jgi:hypothetical protein
VKDWNPAESGFSCAAGGHRSGAFTDRQHTYLAHCSYRRRLAAEMRAGAITTKRPSS